MSGLLILFLISTAFLEFPLYPEWNHRVQLPELIFLIIVVGLISGIFIGKVKLQFSWTYLDLAVGGYLLINVVSALFHPTSSSFLEVFGKFYLAGIYLIFRLGILYGWINWKVIIKGIALLALTIILMTFWAYGVLLFGQENSLLTKFVDYPYFGTVYRAKATLQTPSMYISTVNWCFLFLMTDSYHSGFSWPKGLLLCGLMGCALLSLAKGFLLTVLISLVVITLYLFYQKRRLLVPVVSIVVLVCYIGITNFVYISHPQKVQIGATFLEQSPQISDAHWVPSSYWAVKKAAWITGTGNVWLGVGPGNFNGHLATLKKQGDYPDHLPLYDPHSVWLGAFAETGVFGLIAVIVLVGIATKQVLVMGGTHPFRLCLIIWLLVFIIEGFNGDLMNFRHYWIQFGLIGGLALLPKSQNS